MLRRTIARGLSALVEAVSIGLRGLQIAVRHSTGVEATPGQIRSTLAAAGGGALALFVIAPGVLVAAWPDRVADILEASTRAAVLLVYLLAVSRSAGTRRLFAYHGAEHKVIAAYERLGALPGLEDARAASPIHSRCGTNFMALFVIVAGLVHAFVPRDPVWLGAVWRVVLTPVDAAIAYEVMRSLARGPGAVLGRVLNVPGRALQRLTTNEPTDEQLGVALAALRALVG